MLLGIKGSMNQENDGTSPLDYMAGMLTMMPNTSSRGGRLQRKNLYDGKTEPTGYLRRMKDANSGEVGDVVGLNDDGTYNVSYSNGIQPMALQAPELTVLGNYNPRRMSPEEKEALMRVQRGLDERPIGGELKNNQYRTMPTNSEASAFADNYVAATEFKPWHLVSAPMRGLDLLAPSRWWGLRDDANDMGFSYLYDDRNPGFFIGNDPTKPFSKKFAQEHPYWAMAGNMAFDIPASVAAGWAIGKGYNAASNAYNAGKASFDDWYRARQLSKAINRDVEGTVLNVGEPSGKIVRMKMGMPQEPSTISWEEALDNPTNNLLKWLGKPADYKPKVSLLDTNGKAGIRGSAEEKLMNIFELNGVDLSRLSIEDLTEALKLREKEIISSAPERYTYAKAENTDIPRYILLDYQDGNKVGRTPVRFEDDGNVHVEMTRNLTQGTKDPVHKVEERGLNSAINLANTFGGEGVVSGKQYLSASRQYPVVQKFRDREVIGNTGDHTNLYMNLSGLNIEQIPEMSTMRKMLAMRRAGSNHPAVAQNMPIWLLKSPTFPTPTKSNLFDPSIIDSSGKMNIEWLNPNVLRGIIYPTFGSTLLYNSIRK